jgi:hypothetical protein
MLYISKRNTKIGETASISLPPRLTCPKDSPCLHYDCYACKLGHYKYLHNQWSHNLHHYLEYWIEYFNGIEQFLSNYKGEYFRWHVAGDIPDQPYLNGMAEVALDFPNIKFAVFTKKYNFDYEELPKNLSVLFSTWPNYPIPSRSNIPFAWYYDGSETRIPNTAFLCKKHCELCRMCWDKELLQKHDIILFKKGQLRITTWRKKTCSH